MDAPLLYKPHPSLFPLALLGGLTGTVLLTTLLRLAATLGVSVVDLPLLLGGVLFSDRSTVFGVGHAMFVVAGVLVLPLPLAVLWPLLPGDRFTLRGELVKGALWASSCPTSPRFCCRSSASSARARPPVSRPWAVRTRSRRRRTGTAPARDAALLAYRGARRRYGARAAATRRGRLGLVGPRQW